MKKALLVASVGTTVPEADQSCILPIEAALQNAFPDHKIFRAFTSRIIRKKLNEQKVSISSPEEAISRLTREGYDDITIVPTHLLPGTEYNSLCAACSGHRILKPLLWNENDLDWMANLTADLFWQEGKPILLAGHGSDSLADNIYSRLRRRLPENVFLACLKGEHTLKTLLPSLDALPHREILLMPLMMVAGKHVRDDLIEGPGSWKEILEARELHVHIFGQGLGSLPAVQHRFVQRVSAALHQSPNHHS